MGCGASTPDENRIVVQQPEGYAAPYGQPGYAPAPMPYGQPGYPPGYGAPVAPGYYPGQPQTVIIQEGGGYQQNQGVGMGGVMAAGAVGLGAGILGGMMIEDAIDGGDMF
ncbi:hypothetical protein CEUSTIGMA_g10914.t1 [Chlamydomonas eustigma]|uniref:Uncharacterized protein n=1 Tax=Chlamydomonas eustigma TaxID=1157962 RepID=A0A250XKN5_9CHLO|nr:hypothetical protein CEUSTIGMA_g10914.t1 [Chlamydomonas eustigma]|eukprot:GAX83489.1 hypothetical protein CEUSTIGMA_g10914.t1 [Chlamydomonas eustigma]